MILNNQNIIFFDIETDDKVKIESVTDKKTKRVKELKVKEAGTITSVAFKEQGKQTEAYTIGVNCENKQDLINKIKPIFTKKNNLLIAWNGQDFDDLVIKKHLKGAVKCKFFDLMKGYSKFALHKYTNIALNDVASYLGLKKDDVDPIKAWEDKEYKLLHDYNIKDVELLEAIDNKYNITNILSVLLETTGLKTPNKIFYVTTPLQEYINTHDIQIKSNKKNNLLNYGGLNYYENKGRHDNLTHFDIRSFYPYMFIALNASSNVNYDNLEVIEVSNIDNLTKIGNLWFNDDGTIQVKKQDGKYKGIKLKHKFKLNDSNEDIKGLVKELVEYKNNSTGDLRHAYKILVNGLYGALDSEYFRYRHKNLCCACTFMCRLVLYNCIKHFNGVYAKTDSIWVHNATEEELNNYTASILKQYGLNVYDTDESYLIQWEKEAQSDILYIKDLNNYVEQINGKWHYKGSFTIPAQRKILSEAIINPDLNVRAWVEEHIKDTAIFCEYSKLSEKQKNQWKQNTNLSNKLGLPYKYGFKVYRYYSNDGWVNSSEINDKCPDVNLDYALNRCTSILNQYGFNVPVQRFVDDKPKKNTVNKQVDIDVDTNLDSLNKTYDNLHDVIKAIYEPLVSDSRCNTLNLAMVGTAYRIGYDVRENIDKVRHELGADSSDQLTHNIPLKNDGYGYKKLLEYIEKELADEYTRLIIKDLKPIITDKIDIDHYKIQYIDYKPQINTIIKKYSIKRFKFDENYQYHFLQAPVTIDFDNKLNLEILKNFKDYYNTVRKMIQNGYKDYPSYKKAKMDRDTEKIDSIKEAYQYNVDEFLKEFEELHNQRYKEMLEDIPTLTFKELVDLFVEVVPQYYYKDIKQIWELLTIALLLVAPVNLIVEIIAPSGAGKGAINNIVNLLYDNIILKGRFTEKAIMNRAINNRYLYDGQIIMIEDMGASTDKSKIKEAIKLIENNLKDLVSQNFTDYEKTDTTNNKDVVKINIVTPHGFKYVHYTVKSVINQIRDYGQAKGRTEFINLTSDITDNKDRKRFRQFLRQTHKAHDFNIFKLCWLKFTHNIKPKDVTDEAFNIIYDTMEANGVAVGSKHILKRVIDTEAYLLGAYANNYFEYRFKPLYLDNVEYRVKAIELLEIIKKHIKPIAFDEYDIEQIQIAKAKTSISAKYSYEKKAGNKIEYQAFTIESIQGLRNNKFIKANYNKINDLIYWLVENGYLYTEDKTKQGKNIYIILKHDV